MQHNDATIKLAFQQSQRMDAIDHMARTLIHDLKNHLGGISGAAELLNFDAGDNPNIKELCDLILSATDNAIETINGMSSFLHHPPFTGQPFDLQEFISSQISYYQACLGKQCCVDLKCGDDSASLSCDPVSLSNRCMNLVLNAREAMGNQGSLSILINRLDIAEHARPPFQGVKPGSYIDLCFADTGCGMPPDLLEQAVTTNFSSKEQRAGMGLPLVNEFMRQLAGYLCIESTQDVGTKAHLLFPQH